MFGKPHDEGDRTPGPRAPVPTLASAGSVLSGVAGGEAP